MGGTISGDFETIICLYIPREINSKNKNNCKTTMTTLTVFSNHNLVVVLSVVIIRQLYEYYKISKWVIMLSYWELGFSVWNKEVTDIRQTISKFDMDNSMNQGEKYQKDWETQNATIWAPIKYSNYYG